jgi:hypothetical protein
MVEGAGTRLGTGSVTTTTTTTTTTTNYVSGQNSEL